MLSNGPAWSPDGTKFYFVDSFTKELNEWGYDINTSTVKGPRRIITTLEEAIPGLGHAGIDGCTVDTQGKLWVAIPGSCIARIDPDSGKVLMKLDLKMLYPSSCIFGGPDFKTLCVTSLSPDRYTAKTETDGGVALITFEDESIQGWPMSKCNQL